MADNRQIAKSVLEAVGGKDNVVSVTHCMTRLRFNLKDESVPEDEAVKKLDGVIGVVHSGGQYQVVIGQNVPKVYGELCDMGGLRFRRHWARRQRIPERSSLLRQKESEAR